MPQIRYTNDAKEAISSYRPPYALGAGDFDHDTTAIDDLNDWRRNFARELQTVAAAQKAAGRANPDLARHLKQEARRLQRQDKAAQMVLRRAQGDTSDGPVRHWPAQMSEELDAAFRVYAISAQRSVRLTELCGAFGR